MLNLGPPSKFKSELFVFTLATFLSFFTFLNLTHAAPEDDFVITVKTDNEGFSENNQFTIPTAGGGYGNYNYNVDCNDDGVDEATGVDGDYTCTYVAPGNYTLRIKDNTGFNDGFPHILFDNKGDKLKILSVEQWGTSRWWNMREAFYGAENLVVNAVDAPDLSRVTDMRWMFAHTNFFNQPIGHWDVSNVTNMRGFFHSAKSFNQPLENWDVSNVTDMSWMFNSAGSFNQPLENWDVSNVTDMSWMFNSAGSFNQPLESWDVGNVKNMAAMFAHESSFNQPIGQWDTGSVIDMAGMFSANQFFNQPLENWDVSNVTIMAGMFSDTSAFNQPIGDWNTSGVTEMNGMFSSAKAFNQPIGNWNTSNVTNMSRMFAWQNRFNQSIGDWDTSSVTQMEGMFLEATAFNQPIGGWDTSNVWDMRSMFEGATAFDQDLSDWNVEYLFLPKNMFRKTALSTENYDALINSWGNQTLIYGAKFSGGNSLYCTSAGARNKMVITHGWEITDGDRDPNCPPNPVSIAYSENGFTENPANDGSVNGSIIATLTGDTFQESTNEVQLELVNIPAGLIPSIELSEGNTVLTLTLKGKADLHNSSDSIQNVAFSFTDAAFNNFSAAEVDGAIGPAKSYRGIYFDDPDGFDAIKCAGFSDVESSDSLCPAIEFVRNSGIMTGYTDGTNRFGEEDFLQRDQVTKIIVEAFRKGEFEKQENRCPSNPFPDVNCNSDWGAPYIYFGSNVINIITGYLSGPDTGYFVQSRHVSRAEFAKLIAENYPPYTSDELFYDDVSEGDWFYGAAVFFHENQLFPNHVFNPHEEITRGEVARTLYQLHQIGLL